MISPLLFWSSILAAVVLTLCVRWLGGLLGLLALWCLLGQPNLLAWWPPVPVARVAMIPPAPPMPPPPWEWGVRP